MSVMHVRPLRLFNRIQSGQTPGENPESEFLTKEDFEVGAPIGEGKEQKDAIDEEVSNLVGMTKAKEWFAEVRQRVAFVEQTGTRSDLRVCLNIIITGHPGTGKTTFARLLARFFHTYGVLPKDSFVEQNGLPSQFAQNCFCADPDQFQCFRNPTKRLRPGVEG